MKPNRARANGTSWNLLIRLPRQMEKQIKDEAKRSGMSINTLAVAKLSRPLESKK